jgi:integrase
MPYKREKFWYTDFYHKGKRIRKRIPTTRKDVAVQYEADLRLKLLRGEMGFEEPDMRLPDLIARYLGFSQTNNSPGTFKRDELSLRTFREVSGVKMVSELTPLLMEKYKSDRSKSVSPRTVNIEVKTAKAMLKKAVEWKLLKNNPVASVRLLKQTSSKVTRFLTQEEITALLKAATDTYRPIILTFLKTGLRLNELVNLEWTDIDFNNAQVKVVNKEAISCPY